MPDKLRELPGTLKLHFDSSKIKIWKERTKQQEIHSDNTTDLDIHAMDDTTLYVEGIAASASAHDVAIDEIYTPSSLDSDYFKLGTEAKDTIKLTVVNPNPAILGKNYFPDPSNVVSAPPGLWVDGNKITTDSPFYTVNSTNPVGKEILDIMIGSSANYTKTSADLVWELKVRAAIVAAAENVKNAQLKFPDLSQGVIETTAAGWTDRDPNRLDEDGNPAKSTHIILQEGQSFSQALKNLLEPGKTTVECAVGAQLVRWRAYLSVYGDSVFDAVYTQLHNLYDGQNPFELSQAKPTFFENIYDAPDMLPGDWVTFRNPNSTEIAWRSENSIFLGHNAFFAQGIPGWIVSAEQIIAELQTKSNGGPVNILRPDDALNGPFRLSRPDFQGLRFSGNQNGGNF